MIDRARLTYYNQAVPPENNIQVTTQDCDGSNPVLFTEDTDYNLVLTVTPEQWTRLYSAATAGAELLYPDESIDVVFPLRRAADCMPTFCEAVQDCVESNINIQLTLISITNYWGSEGEDGENPPVIETNPTIAEDCNLDNLFGACTQFVDLIDQTITDIFEIIEAVTNGVEAANEILEAIPGLNFLASVFDIVNLIQETLAENYAAEYTASVRNDLRCALFCVSQEDCTLDWMKIADTLATLTGQSVLTIDLEDFVEFISQGVWSGVEIVYASFWFVVGMMSYGGAVLGITADQLVKLSSSFLNDPDSDWSTLCAVCGWQTVLDLTASSTGTEAGEEAGQVAAYYSAGNGWGHGFYNHICRVQSEDSLECFVSSIRVKHSNMPSLNPQVQVVAKIGGESGTQVFNSGTINLSAGANDDTIEIGATCDYIQVLYVAGIPGNRPTITGYFYEWTVNGTGSNVWSGS